jgi:hypothetical protein
MHFFMLQMLSSTVYEHVGVDHMGSSDACLGCDTKKSWACFVGIFQLFLSVLSSLQSATVSPKQWLLCSFVEQSFQMCFCLFVDCCGLPIDRFCT